ncbi:uncharacterized protein LOC111059303 [Nilaparvata lugens]|uniref:uncharacterized protein LOC111059303 n=1 Tax=Nilaparvata lugens TaxID=108931 RepID=UPI00193E701F|nr:uncharacterized protein LOC111059303 [Nilaparvata lugens]
MLQKRLMNLLFGVSALILFSKLNWYGVYCGQGMGEAEKSLTISRSGQGNEIHISILNSPVPGELNTGVQNERAVCIEMAGYRYHHDNFRIRVNSKKTGTGQQSMDLSNKWSRTPTFKSYICTSPQVANFFFYRVEQIFVHKSILQVSTAFFYDKRLDAERAEITEYGENCGKSTANIKVVTYRTFDDPSTNKIYSGAVKILAP